MDKIGEGEWSDEIESELGDQIAEAIDDFGPDFDAEGNPLEEGESDRIRSEHERERPGRHPESGDGSDDGGSAEAEGDDAPADERAEAATT
jgi:F-type H+-transporting ATPase subunit alpha